MGNKALYFPYINAPESAWMNQMLLYWDQVSSIVPYDFMEDPDKLGSRMRELVSCGLVDQVSPGAFIRSEHDFETAFVNLLEYGPELEARRENFGAGDVTRLHVEKLGPVRESLVGMRLASDDGYPWLLVETGTATEFMAYLATVLGQFDEVDAMPITDSEGSLRALVAAGVRPSDLADQLTAARLRILDRVFPSPLGSVPPAQLADFKARHGDLLPDFRRRVERELIQLATIDNEELRERQLSLFFDEADQRIEEIQARMVERGWTTRLFRIAGVFLSRACPVFGLIRAVKSAASVSSDQAPVGGFAYAAHLQDTIEGARA